MAPYVLPKVVAAVMKKNPRLRLREEKTELLVRGLEEGAALVALDAELGDVEQAILATPSSSLRRPDTFR